MVEGKETFYQKSLLYLCCWSWFFSNKETTDTASSASFLDLYLEFDDSGQLCTQIYDITG